MADELKRVYSHIEADPAEMAAFRQRLAQRLPNPKRAPHRPPWAWLAAAAALLIAASWLWFDRPASLNQLDLATIEQRATSADPSVRKALLSQARKEFSAEDALTHRNATVALCLLVQGDEAINLAAEHLMTEPDPRYRALLLERILDLADDHGFQADHIEALMDREEDRTCLSLYRAWLRLT
jgi:hypothetical protein